MVTFFRSPLIFSFLLAWTLSSCLPDKVDRFRVDPPKSEGAFAPDFGDDYEDEEEGEDGEDGFPKTPSEFSYEDIEGCKNGQCRLATAEAITLNPLLNNDLKGIGDNDLAPEIILNLQPKFSLISGNVPLSNPNYDIFGRGKYGDNCPNIGGIIYQTDLPLGLSLDPQTGKITGTPVAKELSPHRICVQLEFNTSQGYKEYIYSSLQFQFFDRPTSEEFNYIPLLSDDSTRFVLNINANNWDQIQEGKRLVLIDGSHAVIRFVSPQNNLIYLQEEMGHHSFKFSEGEVFDIRSDPGQSFQTSKGTINENYRVYPVSANLNLQISSADTFFVDNGVKFFSNLKNLPDLSFNSMTGSFSGTVHDEIEVTEVEVIAINPLHPDYDTATKFDDVGAGDIVRGKIRFAFLRAPRHINLANQYILEVTTNAAFSVGEIITVNRENHGIDATHQPIARVIDTFDSNYIVVQMIRGQTFEVDQNIDNRFPYSAQRARIISITPNSLIIDVDDASGLTPGNILSIAGSERVYVNMVDNNRLYVKFIASNYTSRNLSIGSDFSPALIQNILSPQLTISTTAPSPSLPHHTPFITSGGGVAKIEKIEGHNYFVSISNHFDQFNSGTADFQNPYQGAGLGTINNAIYDNTFYLYRDDYNEITLSIVEGEEVVYGFSPSLPSGLVYADGKITGIPDDRFQKLPITITANNPVGETTATYYFQVYDSFGIHHNLAKNYQSYISRQEGKGNRFEPCRITRERIEDFFDDGNPLELNCFLEAGEVELYFEGLELDVFFPNQVCNRFVRRPYTFYRFDISPGIYYTETIYKHGGDEVCDFPKYSRNSDGSSSLDDGGWNEQLLCKNFISGGSDYDNGNNGLPNCDNSEYIITPVAWTSQFACYSSGAPGVLTNDIDAADCIRNNGTCSDATYTNYTTCSGADELWTFNGAHNDQDFSCSEVENANCQSDNSRDPPYTNPTASNGSISPITSECISDFGNEQVFSCGGDPKLCIYTADRTYYNHPGFEFEELYAGVQLSIPAGNLSNMSINYEAPYSAGHVTNMSISNYFRDLSCATPYTTDEACFDINGMVTACPGGSERQDAFYDIYTDNIIDFFTKSYPLTNPQHMLDGMYPVYTYICQNAFGDNLATIDLHIREWNSQFSTQDPLDMSFPNQVKGRAIQPVDIEPFESDILHGHNPSSGHVNNRREITNFFIPELAGIWDFTGTQDFDFNAYNPPAGGVCSANTFFAGIGNCVDSFGDLFQGDSGIIRQLSRAACEFAANQGFDAIWEPGICLNAGVPVPNGPYPTVSNNCPGIWVDDFEAFPIYFPVNTLHQEFFPGTRL